MAAVANADRRQDAVAKRAGNLTLDDLFAYGDGQRLVALPIEQPDAALPTI